MAKTPPNSTAPTGDAFVHSTAITPSPTLAAENATLRTRIAELEQLLADARAQIATAAGGAALRFPYPLKPAPQAASILGPRMTFAYWDGAVGLTRQQRVFSLFQGLDAAHAKMNDGTPVHKPAHAILWLLDTMRLQGEA